MTQVLVLPEDFKRILRGEISSADLLGVPAYLTDPDIATQVDENTITITGSFTISGELIFEKGEHYHKEIVFNGGNYNDIVFRGGTFKRLFFRSGNFKGYISIRGGDIGSLILLGGNFNKWLGTLDGIENSESPHKMQAEEPLVIGRFEIEGGSYTSNIWISGGKIDSLEIKSLTAVKIHCKANDDKNFDTISNKYTNRFTSFPKIRNLIISRYSNKDNFLHFSGLKLDTIKFEDFTNLANITIAKVSLNNHIQIENSDLGKTTFIDCDFSKQRLVFDSSKINEIALAGTKLPTSEKIVSSVNSRHQKQLALSQIKKVYQNMGDNVTASKYQAEELNTYMSTLESGAERFNLWLNKISNRHGQSWSQAFGMLIVCGMVFYTSYCFALGFELKSPCKGLYITFRNAMYFLEFLNPIRKSDFLPKVLIGINDESQIPTLAFVIDSIAKIVDSYLIYQLIAAFRKHGKKSD